MDMASSIIGRLGLFVIISLVLAYLSRDSLRAIGTHGFFRFFAWECILALFIRNVEYWFNDPFSPAQLVSWLLLTVSAGLAVAAANLLSRHGRQDPARQEVPLLGMERTTRLVTSGVYAYIRHPLYSALLYLAWGIFFKDISWLAGVLTLAATGFLVKTASADEAESLSYFGQPYETYMERTKRFIPYLY